jgi:hypothetical protein
MMNGNNPGSFALEISDRGMPIRPLSKAAALAIAAIALAPQVSLADEGGVGFWVPGFFGSLAAAPQQPGWSLSSVYYHTSVSAGADVGLAKQLDIRNIPLTFTGQANLNVKATGDLGFFIPNYVFATPVLGGQASVGMAGAYGRTSASLNGTVTGTVTGPLGNTVAFGPLSASISDSAWGFTDVIPIASLRWNSGVSNYMAYIAGDVPIGAYDSARLSNMGIGHGTIDGGVPLLLI